MRFDLASTLLDDHLRKRAIEVVTAEPRQSARCDDVVALPAHAHQRRIERPAAEVVDQDVLALRGDRVPVAVRIFQARGRGLVQHRGHVEARAAEGLQRDEALRAVRVRGSRDHTAHDVVPV
jgi:hypothetical protein